VQQIKQYFVVVTLCLLSACHRPANSPTLVKPTLGATAVGAGAGALIAVAGGAAIGGGAGVGAAIGLMIGDHMQNSTPPFELSQQLLHRHGVQILRIGAEQKLIIPAGQLFYSNSPRLKPESVQVMEALLMYMKHFAYVDIAVDGYTTINGPIKRNIALSQQRAQEVADCLWQAPIDKRIVTAHGYGIAEPIASNGSRVGRAYNERVEIHFRIIHPFKSETHYRVVRG